MQCMGNAIITFFKKSLSENQTLFLLFVEGVGTRLGEGLANRVMCVTLVDMKVDVKREAVPDEESQGPAYSMLSKKLRL